MLPIPVFFVDFVLVVIAATPEELIPKCARVLAKQEKHLRRLAWKSMLQFNGTGVAKVREAIATGTRNIVTGHPVFGCFNIGSIAPPIKLLIILI